MDDGICHVKIGASLSHREHLHPSALYNQFESKPNQCGSSLQS